MPHQNSVLFHALQSPFLLGGVHQPLIAGSSEELSAAHHANAHAHAHAVAAAAVAQGIAPLPHTTEAELFAQRVATSNANAAAATAGHTHTHTPTHQQITATPPAAWPQFWFQKEMMRYVDMSTREWIKRDFDNFSQGQPGFKAYAVQHRYGYELNAAPQRYRKANQAGLLNVKMYPLEKFEWFAPLLDFLARQWWETAVIMFCEQVRKDEGTKEKVKLEGYLAQAGTTIEKRKKVLHSLIGSVHLRSYDKLERQEGFGGPKHGHLMMVMNIHGNGDLVFAQRVQPPHVPVGGAGEGMEMEKEEGEEGEGESLKEEEGGEGQEDGEQQQQQAPPPPSPCAEGQGGEEDDDPYGEGGEEEEETGPELLRLPIRSGDVFCFTGDYRYDCTHNVELETDYRCIIVLRFFLPGREWMARTRTAPEEGGRFDGWRKLDKMDKEQDMLWRPLKEKGLGLCAPSYKGLCGILEEVDLPPPPPPASAPDEKKELNPHVYTEKEMEGEGEEGNVCGNGGNGGGGGGVASSVVSVAGSVATASTIAKLEGEAREGEKEREEGKVVKGGEEEEEEEDGEGGGKKEKGEGERV